MTPVWKKGCRGLVLWLGAQSIATIRYPPHPQKIKDTGYTWRLEYPKRTIVASGTSFLPLPVLKAYIIERYEVARDE